MAGFKRVFRLLVASSAVGCGGQPPEVIAIDEAAKRAIAQDVSIAEAAKQYIPSPIVNYFDGMDAAPDAVAVASALPHPLLEPNAKLTPISNAVNAVRLEDHEVLGRNTWMIWCAGNEGFWDYLASDSLGFIDFLKLLDSRKRSVRFKSAEGHAAGLINEPGMTASPEPDEFGLWLDVPGDSTIREWRRNYLAETFAALRDEKHPSQAGLLKTKSTGAYGSYDQTAGDKDYAKPKYDERIPPPNIYGISSGVVGMRLFPNPYFTAEAQAKWNAARYYKDESYFTDPKLVRPYRVGVSCALCHASFHPLKPPRDPSEPEWENISGNIGAQYLSTRGTFGNLLQPKDFVYHILDSQPPGTIDTSLIASDNINNPNTMNAVFALPERALLSFHNPKERQSADNLRLPSLWKSPNPNAPSPLKDAVPEQWRTAFERRGLKQELEHSNEDPRRVPRILLDGADSIGGVGALARVFLNIGSYWERWNQLHQPVLGFTPQRPFRIADCESNSVYWNATAHRVGPLRDYFLKATPPMPLLATPQGEKRLVPIDEKALLRQYGPDRAAVDAARKREAVKRIDVKKLKLGREAFGRNCIVCHSSVQPESSLVSLFAEPEGETPANRQTRTEKRTAFETEFKRLIVHRQQMRDHSGEVGEAWEHDPGQWLRNPDYQRWAAWVVELPEFWRGNYLSTDYRIPITVVKTNAGRAMATNALNGHLWEDFSSETYRNLPSVGNIEFFDPYKGANGDKSTFMPRHRTTNGAPQHGGGPGFYRVPTLVSIWTTAPFLHNNSVGLFNADPSVDGRLEAYDDAIRKLLWPNRRFESSSYNGATPERLKRDHGLIWRTPVESHLIIKSKIVPEIARMLPGASTLANLTWFENVRPKWLPTAALFLAAMVVFGASNSRWRIGAGLGLVAIGAFSALILWSARRSASEGWLNFLRDVDPWWLAPAIVAFFGVLLALIRKPGWLRAFGYLALVLALVVGFLIYFTAGKLGDLDLGPIPAGTPVNLLANFNSEADPATQKAAIRKALRGLGKINSKHLEGEEAQQVLREEVAPALMEVNKCPDFVMDRGHDFEWFKSMTEDEKEAIVELLKTF